MTPAEGDPLTVLLVVDDPAVREEVRAWLDDADHFQTRVGGGRDAFGDDFDVCLLDVAGLRGHADALAAARESSAADRPTVLTVPGDAADPDAALAALGDAAAHVDETLPAPIEWPVLDRRLRTLGRSRRLSAELAASRSRLQRLVRYLPDAVFVVRDGSVTYANPVAESLLGAEAGGLAERDLASLVPAVDRDAVRAMLEAATAAGRGGPVETVLARAVVRDADGGADDGPTGPHETGAVEPTGVDRVPVELAAIDVGDGEVQVIARDIRERRQREEQLALYRRAMDEATVGITIADHTDDEEALIYVNNEFKRLSGLDETEAIGSNPRMLQTDATDVESVARLRRAIDAGEEASVVLLNRRADGRMWYNALDISPIRDADGEVTHYLGFQRDVTERVARDQRLTVLDRVLRHNIRNRLNVVLGYTDHIEEALVTAGEAGTDDGNDGEHGDGENGDGDDGPVPGAIDLDTLRADAEHVRAAAADVLALSDSARRFREGVVDADDADPVDAAAVVEEVTARIAAGTEDAEIRLSLPDERICVAGAAPLSLVTEELVTNAVEHVDTPAIAVSLAVDGDEAVLTVADDGPGITSDSRTPLGYGSETPTEHGQGIGLWLVRWSVDAVGGTVAYESGPDGGARVVARFPAVEDCDGGRAV
ncbi:PAS domain S-box protein [Halobaculum lipolyticum]|uniref:PAS domain S-box protein n=1 Tax=Halobaculum lipolyticum TaxID=3032001 RepID=A0ABD5WC66_9EURY|nr:PAS domain S-box protein [Halobaculum sp. DT31]